MCASGCGGRRLCATVGRHGGEGREAVCEHGGGGGDGLGGELGAGRIGLGLVFARRPLAQRGSICGREVESGAQGVVFLLELCYPVLEGLRKKVRRGGRCATRLDLPPNGRHGVP